VPGAAGIAAGAERKSDDNKAVNRWLGERNIDANARVLERIEVRDQAWTQAVETVLAAWLKAVRIDRLDPILDGDLPGAGLTLSDDRDHPSVPGSLAEVVGQAGALGEVLGRVRRADSLDQARGMLAGLKAGESVVTPEGVWMGPGWLRQPAAAGAEAGLLKREQEIRELEQQVEQDAKGITEIEARLASARSELGEIEAQLRESDGGIHERQRERAQIHGQLTGINSRIESLARQRTAAEQELGQLRQRQAEDGEAVGQARAEMQDVLAAMEKAESGREPLRAEKVRLDEARENRPAAVAREPRAAGIPVAEAGIQPGRAGIPAPVDRAHGQPGRPAAVALPGTEPGPGRRRCAGQAAAEAAR
jgi:chromosome segregation protein